VSVTDVPTLTEELDKAREVVVAKGVGGGVVLLPPPPEQPGTQPTTISSSTREKDGR
jgi:hypothetical protein